MKIDNSISLDFAKKSPKIDETKLDKINKRLLREKTDEFEAIFVKQILDISLKKEHTLFPKDPGDKIYQSMYNDTFSRALSGNFGISEMLYDYLTQKG